MKVLSNPRSFVWLLASLCLFYLGFEWFFNAYAMLSVDEFWFAHRTYQYKDSLPYRDFAPYKTVLGYYFLLAPMLIKQPVFQTLITIKNMLALLNTLILFSGAYWLTRFFSRNAVLLSVLLVVFSDIFLAYSTNIRVDLLGYWFCFFSLLCLLSKRFWLAGFLLGAGFITTQKCVWFIAASNSALLLNGLIVDRDRKTFLYLLKMNLASAIILALYLLLWSFIAGFSTVITSVFFEASAMYQLDWYDSARPLYWHVITLYNPLLFLLWPCTFFVFLVKIHHDKGNSARSFVTFYASIILLCLIPYKQVFPYYMQVTLPVLLVLYAAFFSWVFILFSAATIITRKWLVWHFVGLYISALLAFIYYFALPSAYLLVCLVPILLGLTITWRSTPSLLISRNLFLLSLLFIGLVYPFILFSQKMLALNNRYQHATITAMTQLLGNDSDYVAGIELLYTKTQPIAGLRHLMGPAIAYLYQPNSALRAVMLPSLYEDPSATPATVIAALEKSRVKFYVNNYRMEALPTSLKNYLASEYMHWWGSFYTYAPEILPGTNVVFRLKISGHYRVLASSAIVLNGKTYHKNELIYLTQGQYISKSLGVYRLQWLPNISINQTFLNDEPEKVIF